MAIETKIWDPAEVLTTPEHVVAYIDAYLEDGSQEEVLNALKTVARSRGMTAIARETGLTREALYKALGENGNPTFETLSKVLGSLGLRLSVAPIDVAA